MANKKKWKLYARVLCVFGLFVVSCTFYLAVSPIQEACDCSENTYKEKTFTSYTGDDPTWGQHRLAVIVPFRERFEELMEFAPHLHGFLNRQKIRHKIYVVNQVDILRFNRGSLINIGYLLTRDECDYIAMHDVDLLPANDELSYAWPEHGPFHVSAPHLHPRYHYDRFVGGIMLLRNDHFKKVNGFSNRYFGWGKEDDEFYVRLRSAPFTISRPGNLSTGLHTFRHIHDKRVRKRDSKRYFDQKRRSSIRDRITGIDTVQYELVSTRQLTIDSAPVTVINVELRCDVKATPWCITQEQYLQVQQYLRTKDTLVPHGLYRYAPNGSQILVETTMAYPTAPMELRYFLNLQLDADAS